MSNEQKRKRIEEIENDLNAHRQGWVGWSDAALSEMKSERLRLLDELKSAA